VPDVQARLISVTPELAAKWLELNDHNRGVVTARVDQYAADMRRGEWRVNGEAIKISADGKILDGQHRLLAVLEADVAIETLVITGLEPDAQETMDQGRARSLADVFKLRGEKYHNPLATATRTLALFELYGEVVQPAYQPAPSVAQASRTLERNPELRDSVAFAYGLRRPWMPSSQMGALHFLFAIVDREAADDFLTKLRTGEGLGAADAVYVLRELLIEAHMERNPFPHRTQLALIIKAWNAYLAGETTTRLTWTPGGARPEPFPRIAGLAREREREASGVTPGTAETSEARARLLLAAGATNAVALGDGAVEVTTPWHDEPRRVVDGEDLEFLLLELRELRERAEAA
jgi:hypothetical protein